MTATRIAADRERLAELEAEFAANPRGLYVAQNLEIYRRKVARYDAQAVTTAASPARVPLTPATPPPARRVPLTPASPPPRRVPLTPASTATREEGLRAIGALMGATADEIEAACQGETTPSAFLRLLTATTAVERVAARISAAGSESAPVASSGKDADPNGVDAVAARIAAA